MPCPAPPNPPHPAPPCLPPYPLAATSPFPPGTLPYCLQSAVSGNPLTILIDTAALGGAPVSWNNSPGTEVGVAGKTITVMPAPGNVAALIGGATGLNPNLGASIKFARVRFSGDHRYIASSGASLSFEDCTFEPGVATTAPLITARNDGTVVTVTRTRFSLVTANGESRSAHCAWYRSKGACTHRDHPPCLAAHSLRPSS
jgi:hypothetical protein